MKKMSLFEIRDEFLNFFKSKDHYIANSYSLVPKNDKSLLLINAGMAPLKPFFLGKKQPPKNRMATCQKCIRTGDIENVGKTDRHATFFEMLGNFSFGDYFKEEAIIWAWEFMTKKMKVSEEKLWVSVYKDDDEAFKIWNENVGVSKEKIVRLDKDDNFWELELGPCGPCSELYIDRGLKYGCGNSECKPGCDCDRYVEVWNLVFSQYDKDEEGNYNLLSNPNIDTGMGLERMAVVSNNADNIFEIEPIKSILKEVEDISGIEYCKDSEDSISLRVITDHVRAVTFMVSDGIIPSNEGRGYVLRRLIRRASRHGKLLGIKDEFLYQLSKFVIKEWKEQYPQLAEKEKQIKKVIRNEEQNFQQTIDQGLQILNDYIYEIKEKDKKVLDGQKAFKLYDTYGFPLDLTKEIVQEQGFTVDEEKFNVEMKKQRERARKARQNNNNQGWDKNQQINLDSTITTDFKGYKHTKLKSKVLALINNGSLVNEISKNQEVIVVLSETPFYAESGGQISDNGFISNNNFKAKVNDVKKGPNKSILHFVEVLEGELQTNDIVEAEINTERRIDIMRNHSATHLLHNALREVLGNHVSQAGSLVTEDKLRFDFTHFEPLTKDEIEKVEEIVNSNILKSLQVDVKETSLEKAKKMGATALFDEKYSDKVRVVSIGDYSIELCGGTHVNNSSQIGMFRIISESGIASSVRRIEAITGKEVYKSIKNLQNRIQNIAELVKANNDNVVDKVNAMRKNNKKLEKEIQKLKSKLATSKTKNVEDEIKKIDGINILTKRIDGMDMNSLRQLGDKIKDKVQSIVIVLGTHNKSKVNFIAMATDDLVSKGIHSGNIIREVAKVTGGGGGGRPNMAQAGGKDASKINEALSKVEDLVIKQINN